eukprot:TRINITY_DN44572_c0_g1_i3.p3 TRINITY_DN44572_c0_g1~~TRINITY_DN44572_c0_g1_i3.p3  ORF type:complete len:163 (-),score=28.56 TRINITY_DN44572_c0_g1_i3:389-877(-)
MEYKVLAEELQIDGGTRALEDFIIKECIYQGVIKGKLDQRHACIHISHTVGRDVPREKLPQLSASLQEWLKRTGTVISSIEECLQELGLQKLKVKEQSSQIEQQVETVRQQVQQDKGLPEDIGAEGFLNVREAGIEQGSSRNKRTSGMVGRFGAGMVRGFLD